MVQEGILKIISVPHLGGAPLLPRINQMCLGVVVVFTQKNELALQNCFFLELPSIAASTASFRLPEVSFCSICVPRMRSPDVLYLLTLRTVCASLVRCRWRGWAVSFSPTESSYHSIVCDCQLKLEVHAALHLTCFGTMEDV